MSLGKIKRVANISPKFAANVSYLFVKVEAAWSSDQEEYLLMTEHEVKEASERASRNPEDVPKLRRGVFTRVWNTKKQASADGYYIAFTVMMENKAENLMFTEEEMDRIRHRVSQNQEDIDANKTGWLLDLLD